MYKYNFFSTFIRKKTMNWPLKVMLLRPNLNLTPTIWKLSKASIFRIFISHYLCGDWYANLQLHWQTDIVVKHLNLDLLVLLYGQDILTGSTVCSASTFNSAWYMLTDWFDAAKKFQLLRFINHHITLQLHHIHKLLWMAPIWKVFH